MCRVSRALTCSCFLPTASDGVLGTGECNATSKGATGAEDEDDPGQHPAAAGGTQTHSRAAAASPGTRHPGLCNGYKDFGMSCMHFHTADFE